MLFYAAYKWYNYHPFSNVWKDTCTRTCCKCDVSAAPDYCTDRLPDSDLKYYLHFTYAISEKTYKLAGSLGFGTKGLEISVHGEVKIVLETVLSYSLNSKKKKAHTTV